MPGGNTWNASIARGCVLRAITFSGGTAVRAYAVCANRINMSEIQARAYRCGWSVLHPELLRDIAERVGRTAQGSRRRWSAGYSSLMPVCSKWREAASTRDSSAALFSCRTVAM